MFLDETWVHAHHAVSFEWYDEAPGVFYELNPKEALLRKGKRIIILHASSQRGFLPGCACVIGRTNSSDYHAEITGDHFMK